MFFATAPVGFHRSVYSPTRRSLERFLSETHLAGREKSSVAAQDEKFYTLSFDVPGIGKDQLNIGIEGSIVRIESKDGAPRKYRAAYELPQDIDVGNSEAKLENGVLTLRLGKQIPPSRLTSLTIN